jgi:osmotically-inducible protein OsmY
MKTKSITTARRVVPLALGGVKALATTSHRAGKFRGRREESSGRPPRVIAFLVGSGAGAAAEYLLDPQQGKRRRHVLRDWTQARLRGGAREAARKAQYAGGKAMGVAAEATGARRDVTDLNDPALAAKVESELFRPEGSPKGTVDVNVANRVVYLRGEVASREMLEDLIVRAQAVDGVARAESLLHLPGEPAPSRE